MKAERIRWDARYRAGHRPHDGPPSSLLRRWLPRLPRGRALDVATGLGRNALFLARAGYQVDAVDISPTGLREAVRRARRARLRRIRWIAADLDHWRIPRGRYDVVVNAFFLKRRMFPALRAAVRPGGILIFEQHLDGPSAGGGPAPGHTAGGGPSARTRRIRPGELRRRLGDWQVLYLKEGLCREGGRTLALGRIVVRRPVQVPAGDTRVGPMTRRGSSGAR